MPATYLVTYASAGRSVTQQRCITKRHVTTQPCRSESEISRAETTAASGVPWPSVPGAVGNDRATFPDDDGRRRGAARRAGRRRHYCLPYRSGRQRHRGATCMQAFRAASRRVVVRARALRYDLLMTTTTTRTRTRPGRRSFMVGLSRAVAPHALRVVPLTTAHARHGMLSNWPGWFANSAVSE
jgi:hypothetical protein